MTNEEYMRSALLGGMDLTGLISRSRGPVVHRTVVGDAQADLSLPELETLQRAGLNISTTFETTPHPLRFSLLSDRTPEVTSIQAKEPAENVQSLDQSSQLAQWQVLRSDILLRLEANYSLRVGGGVRSFLERHSFLVPLLLQTSAKIREFFGSSSKIVLEVSLDPDDGTYRELWARVQTRLAPSDALSALTRFDEEWWLEASASSNNLLNINLEYV
jgi:hypothetical protein